MIRLALALALLLAPAAASAASRSFTVGSFDRLRVDGPFEVRVATGRSPGATAEGDRQILDRLDIAVQGTTLVVRMGNSGWGETPGSSGSNGGSGGAPVVTLTTPDLVAATIQSGAKVTISRMAAQRVDLSINGAGSLALAAADTDQLNVTVYGAGVLSVGGRAARARLLTSGPGTVDAAELTVNDLIVRLDGTGETRAAARYTAQVTSTGLGKVTVLGNAKCTVQATAGGPVECGPKL